MLLFGAGAFDDELSDVTDFDEHNENSGVLIDAARASLASQSDGGSNINNTNTGNEGRPSHLLFGGRYSFRRSSGNVDSTTGSRRSDSFGLGPTSVVELIWGIGSASFDAKGTGTGIRGSGASGSSHATTTNVLVIGALEAISEDHMSIGGVEDFDLRPKVPVDFS